MVLAGDRPDIGLLGLRSSSGEKEWCWVRGR